MESWSDEDISRLHRAVCEELAGLFGHAPARSEALLSDWLGRFPEWTPDAISHDGAFNLAQRIHFALVLDGDPQGPPFLEWRKQFNQVWESRREPQLSEQQKAILRSRGLDV